MTYPLFENFVYFRSKGKLRPYTRFSCGQFCIFMQSDCIFIHFPRLQSHSFLPVCHILCRACTHSVVVCLKKLRRLCAHGWRYVCTRSSHFLFSDLWHCIYIQKSTRYRVLPSDEIERKLKCGNYYQ